jgi:hypothetical protein
VGAPWTSDSEAEGLKEGEVPPFPALFHCAPR